jgi:hypothetical protein
MILSCGNALIDMVPVNTEDGRFAFAPRVGDLASTSRLQLPV